MKRVSSLVVAIIAATSLSAQISFSSDTFFVTEQTRGELEIVAEGSVRNYSNNEIYIKWERTEVDIPSSWPHTLICGSNECFTKYISSSPYPDTIAPSGESNLDVHFVHDRTEGEGFVTMKAWVMGDSANTVVQGIFKGTVSDGVVGLDKSFQNDKIRIYPNPAKDYILIKNLPVNEVSTVEIFNIFGRRMLSFSQAPNNIETVQKFDINVLSKGIYMIRVFDATMNVIFTESLSKE